MEASVTQLPNWVQLSLIRPRGLAFFNFICLKRSCGLPGETTGVGQTAGSRPRRVIWRCQGWIVDVFSLGAS